MKKTVRTCKKAEYTPIEIVWKQKKKKNKRKEEATRSHQRYHQKVQGDYFWFRYPHLYGVSGWTSKAVDHWSKNIGSKADGKYNEETRMGETSKKYCDGWWHDDR